MGVATLNRTVNRLNFEMNGLGGGRSPFASASFQVNFDDAGAGVVGTTVARGGQVATFTRATSAWTNLSTGNIGLVATGNPRSYYSPTGAYLGYLAEGARTNLCQRGEDFSAVWTDVGTPTLSADTTTIGALNLSTVGDDSAAALEGKIQTVTFTGDAVKAVSLYVKQGTSTSSVIRVRDTSAPADRLLAAITWSGSVPVVTMTTGTDLTGTPAQQGSSGVYRLMFATTSVTAANTNSLEIYPATDAILGVAAVGTIQVGGVQAEDALFPSSLIRTPGSATVTRNADVLSYPPTNWLNVNAGTWFANFIPGSVAANGPTVLMADDGAFGDAHFLQVLSAQHRYLVTDGGATQASIAGGTSVVGTAYKTAAAFATNDFIQFVNGAQAGTPDVSGAVPTSFTRVIVGGVGSGQELFGPVRRVAYWPQRLGNGLLTSMTA